MTDSQRILTPADIHEAGLADWAAQDATLVARFATGDFATGLELVNRIGASAEDANHHPDLTLTYPEVAVTLTSHDVGGVTSRDIDLAQLISGHAADLGVDAASGE